MNEWYKFSAPIAQYKEMKLEGWVKYFFMCQFGCRLQYEYFGSLIEAYGRIQTLGPAEDAPECDLPHQLTPWCHSHFERGDTSGMRPQSPPLLSLDLCKVQQQNNRHPVNFSALADNRSHVCLS